MENLLEQVINALFGAARGATTGSAGAAQPQQHMFASYGLLGGSADAQRFLGAQAAREQALYAQGQAAAQANGTSSVSSFYPLWMRNAAGEVFLVKEEETKPTYVTGERMRRLNEDARQLTPEPEHSGSYKPLELETHEDFAVKLAARPKEQNDGTKSPLSVRNIASPQTN